MKSNLKNLISKISQHWTSASFVFLILFYPLLFLFQNCADSSFHNVDVSSSGMQRVCEPSDTCLQFSFLLDVSNDMQSSMACITPNDDANGPHSTIQFSGGCTTISEFCAMCLLHNNESVSFTATPKNSSNAVTRRVTLYFTPDGKGHVFQ